MPSPPSIVPPAPPQRPERIAAVDPCEDPRPARPGLSAVPSEPSIRGEASVDELVKDSEDQDTGFDPDNPLPPLPRLPLGVRVSVFVVGWVLILIGVAGLVLPGIQGVFTIVLGAALLSLDNEIIYRALRRVFRRWPHLWKRVESFRLKTHTKLHRYFRRRQD
jgi:hypothetical protein